MDGLFFRESRLRIGRVRRAVRGCRAMWQRAAAASSGRKRRHLGEGRGAVPSVGGEADLGEGGSLGTPESVHRQQ